ncbi:PH domain-containing protein [Bacillus testis]|uniref:PH domain-containing protein n=1 Tax=Bacillus testis TaxID=1622072 RepID=UPI00067E6DAA|nr:PH domain-containing protein [Bacillus testis]
MTNQKHRFHPVWILFEAGVYVKQTSFIILFVFVLRFNINTGWVLWAKIGYLLMSMAVLVYMVCKWWRLHYEFKKKAIVFHEGVFVRRERIVPVDKIQNLHTKTNIVHRIFGLTSLTIETGTTMGESAIVFKVLTPEEYDAIAVYLNSLDTGEEAEPAVPVREVMFRSTMKDNVKAAFTSFSFLAIFPVLLAVYSKIDEVFNLDKKAGSIFSFFGDHLLFLLPLAIVALLLSAAFGFVQTMIKYGNYEISEDEERIYIKKGMLEHSSFSIQKDRVQAIEVRRPLLKRLFGMAEIKLISAGNIGDEDDQTNSLYPFMPKDEAYELVNALLPMYEIEEQMMKLPKKILWLRLIRPYYVTLAVFIVMLLWLPEWLWIAAAVFLIAVVFRILDFVWTGYRRKGAFMQIRKGGFMNETFLTRVEKIQEIQVRHSWLQRKFNVATIEFTNRAKPIRVNELKDLSIDEASGFFNWYHESIKQTKKRT